jgi:hypothetical protein
MKYLLTYKSLIESRRDDLEHKYVDKLGVDADIFNLFYSTQYAEWLLKIYLSTDKSEIEKIEKKGLKFHEYLLDLIKIYDNNKKNLSVNQITDINDLYKLRKVVDEVTEYDVASDIYRNDIWVLENSYEWFIFKPYTYEVSHKYGNRKQRSSNWCTTYKSKKLFEIHDGEDGGLLYFINKLDYTKDMALEMHTDNIKIWDYRDDNIEKGVSIMDVIPFYNDSIPYQIVENNLERLEDEIPEYSVEYINNVFEDFLNIYYSDNNFRLLSWIYNIDGMKSIIKHIDLSNVGDYKPSDLLDILIKEYPKRVELNSLFTDNNKKHYFNHCSMYIPADDILDEYDIKISKNKSASDKWQKIFDVLSLDEIRKIIEKDDLKILDLDLFKQQFIRNNKFDYSKVLNYFFGSEEKQWESIEKLFDDGKYDVDYIWDIWDIKIDIKDKLSKQDKISEMDDFDYNY